MSDREELEKRCNFREVPEPNACSNCDHPKGSIKLGEGYDRCEATGLVLSWHLKHKRVCDAWKKRWGRVCSTGAAGA